MIGFFILALAAAPVAAQPFAPVEIGAWHIAPEGDTRCHMLGPFGNHAISFAADVRGNGNLAFFRLDGGLGEQSYPASYSWDGWKTQSSMTMIPLNVDKSHAVLASGIRTEFFVSLFRARHIWLRIPKIGFDDDLKIDDADRVFGAFRDCIEAID